MPSDAVECFGVIYECGGVKFSSLIIWLMLRICSRIHRLGIQFACSRGSYDLRLLIIYEAFLGVRNESYCAIVVAYSRVFSQNPLTYFVEVVYPSVT